MLRHPRIYGKNAIKHENFPTHHRNHFAYSGKNSLGPYCLLLRNLFGFYGIELFLLLSELIDNFA